MATTIDGGVGNDEPSLFPGEATIGCDVTIDEAAGNVNVAGAYIYSPIELAGVVGAGGSDEAGASMEDDAGGLVAGVGGVGPS